MKYKTIFLSVLFLLIYSSFVFASCIAWNEKTPSPADCCAHIAYIAQHSNGTYAMRCAGWSEWVVESAAGIFNRDWKGLITEDDWQEIQNGIGVPGGYNISEHQGFPGLDEVWQQVVSDDVLNIQMAGVKGNPTGEGVNINLIVREQLKAEADIIWEHIIALFMLVVDFIVLVFYIILIRLVLWMLLVLFPGAIIKLRDKTADAYMKARWNT